MSKTIKVTISSSQNAEILKQKVQQALQQAGKKATVVIKSNQQKRSK